MKFEAQGDDGLTWRVEVWSSIEYYGNDGLWYLLDGSPGLTCINHVDVIKLVELEEVEVTLTIGGND